PVMTTDGGSSGFSIVVKLENVGEHTIPAEDGYIQIWGLDAGSYNSDIPDFKKYFNEQQGFGPEIRGAIKNYDGTVLNGGVATVDFGDLKYMPTIQGDMMQTIWANVCYRYTTRTAAQICVKNNIEQGITGKDICIVEGEKNPQNSGGPIQVTSLKESYAGNGKIGITLKIEHSGSGDNFFKDDQLFCNNVESNTDKGKVRIEFSDVLVAGNSVPVVCQGVSDDGYIRLFKDGSNKETTMLYCTIDVSGNNNIVEVPLDLELSYVYLQHVATDITLRHIAQ
ncbi:MAG: hypothetical protein ACP5N1_00245, partial [Candidatus Woesearchaeota archaeon]